MIADDLIKPNLVGNPLDIINNFFSTFSANTEELKQKNRENVEITC